MFYIIYKNKKEVDNFLIVNLFENKAFALFHIFYNMYSFFYVYIFL